MDTISQTKKELHTLYMLKDLRELRYLLGKSFQHEKSKTLVTQAAYCRRLLRQFQLKSAGHVLTQTIKNADDFTCKVVIVEAKQEDSKDFLY